MMPSLPELRRLLLPLLLLLMAPAGLSAQVGFAVTGLAGASFDIDDRDPVTGGGLAGIGDLGVVLREVEFGGEFGEHGLGHGRTARQIGAYARFWPPVSGRAQPFLVIGLASYRYDPAPGNRSHAAGGSLGGGVQFPLLGQRIGSLVEVRFHSSFDRIRLLSTQDFISVMLGLRAEL